MEKMNVFIFKTSVNEKCLKEATAIINTTIPKLKWNFDLEDCDNILRIESNTNISHTICSTLNKIGIYCEELH